MCLLLYDTAVALRTMLEVVDDNTGRYRPKVGPGMAVEQLRETLAISAREHLEREIYEIVVVRGSRRIALATSG